VSGISSDLESFLEVVHKVASSVAEPSTSPSELRAALDSVGLLSLARDTADEPDSRLWVAHTVRVAAQTSPSTGFVLAARYAADRTLGADDATEPTLALTVPGASAVVATALDPRTVVIIDTGADQVVTIPWADVAATSVAEPRTGLKGARFVSVDAPASAAVSRASTDAAMAEWDLLTGAALAGLARRAVSETQAYVVERRQFGVPIASFAGLRALVTDMELKAAGTEANLAAFADGSMGRDNLCATAGRATIEICLDAIQAHGGYGYIDEYPLADLLRDAISLQARSGGRRLHLARVADRTLGPPHGGRS
jgi:Acyl-CoA dehydrogenase, C-terminal domain